MSFSTETSMRRSICPFLLVLHILPLPLDNNLYATCPSRYTTSNQRVINGTPNYPKLSCPWVFVLVMQIIHSLLRKPPHISPLYWSMLMTYYSLEMIQMKSNLSRLSLTDLRSKTREPYVIFCVWKYHDPPKAPYITNENTLLNYLDNDLLARKPSSTQYDFGLKLHDQESPLMEDPSVIRLS